MTSATKRLLSHLTYRYLKGLRWARLGFGHDELPSLKALVRRNLIETKKYTYLPNGEYFNHYYTVRLTKKGKNKGLTGGSI